jgi:hypothetical protein
LRQVCSAGLPRAANSPWHSPRIRTRKRRRRTVHNFPSLIPNSRERSAKPTRRVHAPHDAPKEWRDKFAGKFDQGWDKVRDETFERQKKLGVIPPDTKLTPPASGLPAWHTLSPEQQRVYARMKEVVKGRVDRTIPIRIALDETPDVGEDAGTPVNLSYDVPFKFSGKIEKVTIELK